MYFLETLESNDGGGFYGANEIKAKDALSFIADFMRFFAAVSLCQEFIPIAGNAA